MYQYPRKQERNRNDAFNVSDIRSSLSSSSQNSGSNQRFSFTGLKHTLDFLNQANTTQDTSNRQNNVYMDDSSMEVSVQDIDMDDMSYSVDYSQTYPQTYPQVHSQTYRQQQQLPSQQLYQSYHFGADDTPIQDVDMIDVQPVYQENLMDFSKSNQVLGNDIQNMIPVNYISESKQQDTLYQDQEQYQNGNGNGNGNGNQNETENINKNANEEESSEYVEPPPMATGSSIFSFQGLRKLKNAFASSKKYADDTPPLIELSDDEHDNDKFAETPIAETKKESNEMKTLKELQEQSSDKDKNKDKESSQSHSTSHLLFSPTTAGAELALYHRPTTPKPSEDPAYNSFESLSSSDSNTNVKLSESDDLNSNAQASKHLQSDFALPTPTPAWISMMMSHLRHQQTLSLTEQKEIHRRERVALAPYVVSSYLQLFSNLALAGLVAYVLVRGYFALQHDVVAKLVQRREEIIQKAGRCAREYLVNECRSDVRRDILEDQCNAWEVCIEKALVFIEGGFNGLPNLGTTGDDSGSSSSSSSELFSPELTFESPTYPENAESYGVFEIKQIANMFRRQANGHNHYNHYHDSLSHFPYIPALAETLADIGNAFFERVTVKTLVMFVFVVLGSVYLFNFGFGYLRAKMISNVNLENSMRWRRNKEIENGTGTGGNGMSNGNQMVMGNRDMSDYHGSFRYPNEYSQAHEFHQSQSQNQNYERPGQIKTLKLL